MVDFTKGFGPLSALGQQPKTQFETDPMSSYQAPTIAAEAEADPEEDNTAALYRKARETLMASRNTGMDPLTTFLLAAGQPGAGGLGASIGRGAAAAQQVMAESAKSDQARQLKLLELGIEEGKYKDTLKQRKAEVAARLAEKNKPEIKEIYDPKTGRKVMARVYPDNRYEVIGGVEAAKPEKPGRTIGYDEEGNPVTEENPGERFYMPAEYTKKLTSVRQTIDGIANAKQTLDLINKNPSSFGIKARLVSGLSPIIQSMLPDEVLSEEDKKIRAKVYEDASAQIHALYGVAVSSHEKGMLANFLPTDEDTLETLIPKLKSAYETALMNAQDYNPEIVRKSGSRHLEDFYRLSKNPYGDKKEEQGSATSQPSSIMREADEILGLK